MRWRALGSPLGKMTILEPSPLFQANHKELVWSFSTTDLSVVLKSSQAVFDIRGWKLGFGDFPQRRNVPGPLLKPTSICAASNFPVSSRTLAFVGPFIAATAINANDLIHELLSTLKCNQIQQFRSDVPNRVIALQSTPGDNPGVAFIHPITAYSLEGDSDTLLTHWKCLLACTLVSMCPFQYGVDFGIIGGLQAMPGFLAVFGNKDPSSAIGYNISPGRQQLISSLMILGAFISSTAGGPIANYIGRKASIWTACVLCIVSNVIMMTTEQIGGIYAGRLLIGLANGLFMTFAQLYLQECSPAKYRGLMIGSFQSWTSIGSLVGTVIDNFAVKIGGKQSYIVPLGIVYVVPGIIAVGLLFIPESPRWLLQQDREEAARAALKWLRPHADLVDAELADIKTVIDAEKNLSQNAEIVDIWRNKTDRRRALLAIGAVTLQAASGAMYMISYGTYFFEMAGIGSAFENTCILTGLGVFIILVNSAIITRWGRRRVFLMWGMIICGICQLIIAAVYTADPGTASTGKVVVGISVLYIVGYNGMVATYAWLCGGEFPSQRLRSYTFGLAASVGFLGAWLTTFTAPYFINPSALNWGPKYGYIWTPSCFIGAAWVWFYLPEVKNRTFEEIDEMFEAGLPARKFRTYKCVGPAALAAMGDKGLGGGSEKGEETVVSHEEVIQGEHFGKAAAETGMMVA
ncbi:hypothetical protein G7Y89_g13873 [Cudoniella acicularis]|uniref:Major facilitator superfamily (MFS) profile domain-containing protein n=1 Tax=Cudoniella acicularis TaxID=354080 RepID=A0A8H4R7Q4_9HELO|nr:hypothetical protein G7Y89_g13873 [Cudoniella acicularis]